KFWMIFKARFFQMICFLDLIKDHPSLCRSHPFSYSLLILFGLFVVLFMGKPALVSGKQPVQHVVNVCHPPSFLCYHYFHWKPRLHLPSLSAAPPQTNLFECLRRRAILLMKTPSHYLRF